MQVTEAIRVPPEEVYLKKNQVRPFWSAPILTTRNIRGLILRDPYRSANSIPGFRNIQKTRKLSSIEPDPGKKRLPVGPSIS
jgi:hypothetical protein